MARPAAAHRVNQRPDVKLLLDEMFSPAIAADLRERGHDVIAVADRPDLRAKSDEEIFAWASAEARWLLTENVKDFRPIMLRAWLVYHDGLLKLMRDGGFSYDQIHHALHALGSRALGFSQELFDPGGGTSDEETADALGSMADQIPHLVAMFMEVAHDDPGSTLGWCDD